MPQARADGAVAGRRPRHGASYLDDRNYIDRTLVGLVATDGDAMPIALVGVVVPERVVLDAAIVPKGDRVRLPLEAHAELRRLDVPIEHFQDRSTLEPMQTDDPCGEYAANEQALSPRYRV